MNVDRAFFYFHLSNWMALKQSGHSPPLTKETILQINRSTSPLVPLSTSSADFANLAVSWGLMILIWLVQLIIYPGFHRIPPDEFVRYHRWYALRISVVVLPLMLGELIFLIGWWLSGADGSTAYIATLAVFIVWLSTFGLQVPIHKRLQAGKSSDLINRLVATNWIRTAAWSLKALVVTAAVFPNP